jgi:uncharacterized protein YigA (DUF484 family)
VSIQGITENDIANYLANTPGFFERNADLLAAIQLTSPHGQRAVSLQERQMEMLRDKHRGLEHKIVEMVRHGQENTSIAEKLHRWVLAIMRTSNPGDLPDTLVSELRHQFMIPQAAIRIWGAADVFHVLPFARAVGDDVRSFANSLTHPYCGVNSGFEAVSWLEEPRTVMSMALIPLRPDDASETFGMLVVASPDPTRYSADMGTEFLQRIGDIASAGLTRLLPVK